MQDDRIRHSRQPFLIFPRELPAEEAFRLFYPYVDDHPPAGLQDFVGPRCYLLRTSFYSFAASECER